MAVMNRILFLTLSLLLTNTVFADATGSLTLNSSSYKKADLSAIDSQLESLENLKEYYREKAKRLRNKGDRLSYNLNEESLPIAEKCWKSANNYDKISDQIQEEINNLEQEREQVVKRSDY